MHDALYRSGSLVTVDLQRYLEDLTRQMVADAQTNGTDVTLTLDVEALPAPLDVAVRCGLIVCELAANALTHAFPAGCSGAIAVSLRRHDREAWELTVRDDGVGTAESLDRDGLGIQLIEMVAAQLGGGVRFSTRHGVEARLLLSPSVLTDASATATEAREASAASPAA